MVGRPPLERLIGVRVPDRQQSSKVSKDPKRLYIIKAMDVENYLRGILTKHSVSSDFNKLLAIGSAQTAVSQVVTNWAGRQLHEIKLSGSVAKGTAVSSSADLDLFISLKSDTTGTWQEL